MEGNRAERRWLSLRTAKPSPRLQFPVWGTLPSGGAFLMPLAHGDLTPDRRGTRPAHVRCYSGENVGGDHVD
jgi:hypothetical protein